MKLCYLTEIVNFNLMPSAGVFTGKFSLHTFEFADKNPEYRDNKFRAAVLLRPNIIVNVIYLQLFTFCSLTEKQVRFAGARDTHS